MRDSGIDESIYPLWEKGMIRSLKGSSYSLKPNSEISRDILSERKCGDVVPRSRGIITT